MATSEGEAVVELTIPGKPEYVGVARLAIVAPREPARVLESETGDVVGVANGELYNHRELERELLERGHDFIPGPDTALCALNTRSCAT